MWAARRMSGRKCATLGTPMWSIVARESLRERGAQPAGLFRHPSPAGQRAPPERPIGPSGRRLRTEKHGEKHGNAKIHSQEVWVGRQKEREKRGTPREKGHPEIGKGQASQSKEPQASHRDRALGSEKARREGAAEKEVAFEVEVEIELTFAPTRVEFVRPRADVTRRGVSPNLHM